MDERNKREDVSIIKGKAALSEVEGAVFLIVKNKKDLRLLRVLDLSD